MIRTTRLCDGLGLGFLDGEFRVMQVAGWEPSLGSWIGDTGMAWGGVDDGMAREVSYCPSSI